MHRDLGLHSSQMLLANVEHMACPDAKVRRQVLDYMKQCSEFQLELGGRQVLVCWGCGVHLADMTPEQAWLNSVASIRSLAKWGLDQGLLVDLEIEPHVYFILNSSDKAARMVEDIGLPNVFPNLDIGHFVINREAPHRIEKIKNKIIHIHLSETAGLRAHQQHPGNRLRGFRLVRAQGGGAGDRGELCPGQRALHRRHRDGRAALSRR